MYLAHKQVNIIDNLDFFAKQVVEGFLVGLHKSPYHGFSVEFSEHRPYEIGDEVRHIDWKLWSKTNKYFVKQFLKIDRGIKDSNPPHAEVQSFVNES